MKESTLLRAMTRDGSARIVLADTTAVVQRGHEIHESSKTVTALLGRCLTAASLMGSLLKDKNDNLSLQIKGDGPAGNIICISDYSGNVRGYVENPDVELLPNVQGKLDVGGAVGKGTLTVVRNIGEKEPYIGVSNLVSGEIAEDITEYFAVSEQTPSVCALGVRANTDNSCKAAGGFLLQLLPGVDEEIIPVLEKNLAGLESVSLLLEQGHTLKEIADMVFSGIEYDIFDEMSIAYQCPCSRESYARALMSLGETELSDMIRDGKPVETCCRYCRTRNLFTPDEVRDMIRAIKE